MFFSTAIFSEGEAMGLEYHILDENSLGYRTLTPEDNIIIIIDNRVIEPSVKIV